MVALAEFGSPVVSPYAAQQQLFGIVATYAKNTGVVNQYLGSDGSVVGTLFVDGYWRPSVMLVEQGPKRYFLFIEGTVGAVQAALQADNTANKYRDPVAGAYGGTFWVSNGIDVDRWVLDRVDFEDPAVTMHIAGHSLGGSVANVVAMRWANRLGPSRVSLISFGEPRTYATGMREPRPSIDWRVVSTGDIVPTYPSDGKALTLTSLLVPAVALFETTTWTHYGALVPLAANGAIAENPLWVDPLPPNVGYGSVDEHLTRNYAGRLEAWNRSNGSSAAFTDVTNRIYAVLDGTPTQRPVAYLATDTIVASPPVIGAVSNALGTGIPAAPFLTSGGFVADYKQIWNFTGVNATTWQEIWTITASSAVAASTPPQSLINLRMAFADPTVTLVSITAINLSNSRDAKDTANGSKGTYASPNPAGDGPNVAGLCIKYTLRASDQTSRKIQFRGFNDSSIVATATSVPQLGATTAASIISFFQALLNGQGVGIKKRTPATNSGEFAYNPIRSVSGVAGGGLADVTLLNTPNVAIGDMVYLSLGDAKTLPGLKGTYKVLGVTGMVVTIRYTVANNQLIASNCGRLRKIVTQALQALNVPNQSDYVVTTKKTAAPSKRIRAGRRAQRVRTLA